MNNPRSPFTSSLSSSLSSNGAWRRGNALVLVSAMLVLLVLIATAYLSRTQSQRDTAAAMQNTSGDDRRIESIRKQLASEIALHLFVKPVDPKGSGNWTGGDSAGNRIPPSPYSVRYGVEPAAKAGTGWGDQLNSSLDPSNPTALVAGADGFPDGYNFAPYSVIPWTNWPDFTVPTGNASGTRFTVTGEPNGNPLGNPGFGDTRWLRSTEPVRMNRNSIASPGEVGIFNEPNGDRFSHWAHLSWLPTPANGWRVVKDIADIEGTVLQGAMDQATNDAFGTPYEQWLPNVVPTPIPNPGSDPLADNAAWSNAFITRRDAWFTRAGYQDAITNAKASTTLPNLFKLDDPLGIGRSLDPTAKGVSKSDEWIDKTPRNIVSRTFCDADGDGFTDSFWFLAPVGKERNVRTIVGVSVIDNAGMVDLNVATRADRRTTVGFTPSDLALVTSEPERSPDDKAPAAGTPTDTLVGLFDNPYNQTFNTFDIANDIDGFASPSQFRVQFDPYRWAGNPTYYKIGGTIGAHDVGQPSFLQALGLRAVQTPITNPPVYYWNDYFYGRPFVPSATATVTNEPFGGDMRDNYGPGGPARPGQENPLYRTNLALNTQFRSALPNQPFTRPTERNRWFRSAATGIGSLYAESLNASLGAGATFEQASDLFGIPVPTRRFDASDELELRAHAGNNDPSSMSRLERSLNADDIQRDPTYLIADSVLRSTVLRGEAGGGEEQLTSPQLVKDLRRKVTVVSGQRNEMMPPWLWIGRPYLVAGPNSRETFQNSMLWLGLHPETPGPRDEDGNGRIDGSSTGISELGFGKMDLWRVSTSADPFLDGVATADMAINQPMDGRDWNRAIRYFEELNKKLDLRQPLLVNRDVKDENSGAATPDGVPDRNADGTLDQYLAMTVTDQRLAMQDFVRLARARLRAALRIHSPMTPLSANAYGLITTEVLGINDSFADYTDRFYEQFMFTTNTKTRIATSNGSATLGSLASPSKTAKEMIAYRSAWSTEALTASMAANIATWRSRADQMFDTNPTTGFADSTQPLRAVNQPILPDNFSAATPYSQSALAPLATRAVDPSKPTGSFQNYDFVTGSNPGSATSPDATTADVVFPGVEKHPFFTEVFFGWVYPATTTDDIGGSGKIVTARFGVCDCLSGGPPSPERYKFVAVVNGRVGDITTDPKYVDKVKLFYGTNGNQSTPDDGVGQYAVSDIKRDTLDEIRTPVLVVQVANPWNEPIRLGDYRINIFGFGEYDFPDYELDSAGNVVLDSNNRPVPLMLAPSTETEPATATVYLIANVLGNPTNTPSAITNTPVKENDLENVATWDPIFRRRWLDYFDLLEYSDPVRNAPVISAAAYATLPQIATSPISSPLYPYSTKDVPTTAAAANVLPRSKLLNAMQNPLSGAAPGITTKKYIDNIFAFKQQLTRDNMARGITLHRVLKNPAVGNAINPNLQAAAKDITLEVDRFDGHTDFDHWSTTNPDATTVLGAPAFADERNFDTNLITGGRFASAAARITLPPTTAKATGGKLWPNVAEMLGAAMPGQTDRSYDGPGADINLFPPPTARAFVRASDNEFRTKKMTVLDLSCTTCERTGEADSVVPPDFFPGIVLGEIQSTASPNARPVGDYFTTWTHASRNWSRLFDAKFVAERSWPSGIGANMIPNDRTYPAAVSAQVLNQLPVWGYTRQLVTGSFASNPLPSDSTKSRSPMIPVERFAPRFMFANRTEPEVTNRPFDMQPSRIETWNVVLNRSSTPKPPGKAANKGVSSVTARSQGDVFALGFKDGTLNPIPKDINDNDPDLWTVPYPWTTDATYQFMRATKSFKMLLTPVWAPLPDFCGMVEPNGNAQDTIIPGPPVAAPNPCWPTLVLRKPTSFNNQTVVFNPSGSNYYPQTAGNLLPKQVTAYYGNPRTGAGGTPLRDTKFVTPWWSVPAGCKEMAGVTAGETLIPDDQYRVYMADKGARLLDHDGLLLPVDLGSGGQAAGRPWRARGMWNTLDRIPQEKSLQMLQKDDDFEQVGELLDVFAWGPAYRCDNPLQANNALAASGEKRPDVTALAGPTLLTVSLPNPQAKATFAEIMSNRVPGYPVGEGPNVNRIQVDPLNVAYARGTGLPYQYGGTSALRTPYAPNVPWGMRIFDCFTVDGAGAQLRFDWTDPANSASIALGGANVLSAGVEVPDISNTTGRNTPVAAAGGRPAGALVPMDVNRNTFVTPSVVTAQTLAQWEYDRSPSLAGNYSGTPTKGLININTAPVEVLKTLPFMTELVYDDTGRFDGAAPNTPIAAQIPEPGSSGDNRFVRVPLTMEIYRDQLNPNPAASNWTYLPTDPMTMNPGNTALYPTYVDRGGSSFANLIPDPLPTSGLSVNYNTGMQSQRGFSTVGEVIGLARQAADMSWTIRAAGLDPYNKNFEMSWQARDDTPKNSNSPTDLDPLDGRLSTDRQGVRQFDYVKGTSMSDRRVIRYDSSYGDSEEQNLLFKGISNLITTRSDVFTVYFRVRTVKQNPIDGKWNGSDRDSVIDDARYVMCVDRTNVNRPTDEPKIVYFSRVPE
ncbi:MAG: hypothetical protein K8R92_03595 [Planctomycetes bacterium]|nr:hypothetical protein [Planctomycetota bacterium]